MGDVANGQPGTKFGEDGHFKNLGDKRGDQSYAVRRFSDEVNRLYGVMNYRLYDRRYLAGAEYTIADMICYSVGHAMGGAGRGHQPVQALQALVRRDQRATGGTAWHVRGQRSRRRSVQAVKGRAGAAGEAHVQPTRPAGAR